MARIRINFSSVQSANKSLKMVLRSMEQLEWQLSTLQQQLSPEIQSRYGISAQLSNCKGKASNLTRYTQRLHNLAASGVQKYQETESNINRRAPDSQV